MKKVSIVIPNWNGVNFLRECLLSLKNLSYQNYDIVVIDNASRDGSIEMLKNEFSFVNILKNKRNIGFAPAVNQGIKYAIRNKTDYILLLNNDTVVKKDFLSKIVQTIQGENIGIAGCKINYFDDKNKIWFAGGNFIKWRASGQHRYWMKNDDDLSGEKECDFITGCCMLIKKDVFADVGFFYEPYYLGVEDLDFCYFAKKSGWKIKVNLNALIYHKVSLSRDGEFSFSNGYYGTRNRLIFAFKRSENYFGGIVLLFIVLPIRFAQWFFAGKMLMTKGAFWGVVDFLKGKQGKK